MGIDGKYFTRFDFTNEQVMRNLLNAQRDLSIARRDRIPEVKFNYAYSALLKAGMALLSHHRLKVKSVPGHHVKIIEYLAGKLGDESIAEIGNVMRNKRNLDLYAGGTDVTGKECAEYFALVEKVVSKVKGIIEQDK